MINKKNIILTLFCSQLIFPIYTFSKENTIKSNSKSFEGRVNKKAPQIPEEMLMFWSFGLINSNEKKTFGKTIESINVISKSYGLNDELRVILADAYFGLANKYYKAKLYDEANDALERAEISLNNAKPNNTVKQKKEILKKLLSLITIAKSKVFLSKGNYDEAEKMLIKSVENKNSSEITYLTLGVINYKKGNISESESLIKKGIDLFSEKSQAYYFLAMIYNDLNENNLALENLQASLRLGPTDKEKIKKDFTSLKDNEVFKTLVN